VVNWRPTEGAQIKMIERGIPGALVDEVLEYGEDSGPGKVPGSHKKDLALYDGRTIRVIYFQEESEDVVFSVQWLEPKRLL
jgi:hypothetical protein